MAGRSRNSLLIVDAFLQPHEIIAIVPDLITLGEKAFLGLSTSLSLSLSAVSLSLNIYIYIYTYEADLICLHWHISI